MSTIGNKFGRRSIALFWLLIVGIVIGTLIYLGQIAVLYVLATLSLVALLLTVGFADLENISREGVDKLSSSAD